MPARKGSPPVRETVIPHILSLLNGISFSSGKEHASLPGAKAANSYTQPVHIRRFAALRGMGRTFRRLCRRNSAGLRPRRRAPKGHAVRPSPPPGDPASTRRAAGPGFATKRFSPWEPPSVYGAPPPAAKSRSLPAEKGRAAQKATRNRRAKKQSPPRMGKLLFYKDMNRLTLLFLRLWRR